MAWDPNLQESIDPVDWDSSRVLDFFNEIGLYPETVEILKEFSIDGATLVEMKEADLQCDELELESSEVEKLLLAVNLLTADPHQEKEMVITSVSVDSTGSSYFGEQRVPLSMLEGTPGTGGTIQALSAVRAAQGVVFKTMSPASDASPPSEWSTEAERQYVIFLDGAVKITITDGTFRVINPGQVILLEDVSGTGHKTCVVDDKVVHSVCILLNDEI
uniref:SAM domain-containing protein n=1 Tax=Polyblepharides amylifera TaxID=1486889 RepID=A0A7R9XNS4_9CHLO|mmetsp:Transcript_455/g.639  ORF Transcript_455/g.639 Transcript_455/m.639 type:complete len:218 (+) Transcript_455:151-804(+)|eukprot:CAMPEP_0196572486 /NCGR_PEP_ID=MMETSP1081-20130531/2543_1 /TAXON_ID=36882 /ORGANISM="Pyramimonas amylifera, Strain CCMP720" /LENGTH=217 /DNA_ID=CAMNT_0041889835 /DNA_START=148 /DNA_END=801 /DNA_ORIENTATION=-